MRFGRSISWLPLSPPATSTVFFGLWRRDTVIQPRRLGCSEVQNGIILLHIFCPGRNAAGTLDPSPAIEVFRLTWAPRAIASFTSVTVSPMIPGWRQVAASWMRIRRSGESVEIVIVHTVNSPVTVHLSRERAALTGRNLLLLDSEGLSCEFNPSNQYSVEIMFLVQCAFLISLRKFTGGDLISHPTFPDFGGSEETACAPLCMAYPSYPVHLRAGV